MKVLYFLLVMLLAVPVGAVTWNPSRPNPATDGGATGYTVIEQNEDYLKQALDAIVSGNTDSSISNMKLIGPIRSVTLSSDLPGSAGIDEIALVRSSDGLNPAYYAKTTAGWQNASNATTAGVSGIRGATATFYAGAITLTGTQGLSVTYYQDSSSPETNTIVIGTDSGLSLDTGFLYTGRAVGFAGLDDWAVNSTTPPDIRYSAGSTGQIKVYDFADASDSRVSNHRTIPEHISTASDIRVDLWFSAGTNLEGAAKFEMSYEACGIGETYGTSCTTGISEKAVNLTALADQQVSATFTVLAADIADGDVVYLDLVRDVSDDSYTTSASLWGGIMRGISKNSGVTW